MNDPNIYANYGGNGQGDESNPKQDSSGMNYI